MVRPTRTSARYDSDHAATIINVHASGMPYEFWQEEMDRINSSINATEKASWIPCRKCEGCRADQMKEWAVRCMAEASCWENNWFVTLTLSDDNLKDHIYDEIITPKGITYCDDGTWGASLQQGKGSEIEKFMKDLREYFRYHYGETDIRFYMCGEYGSLYGRPHYHMILFNLNLKPDKLKAWKLTPEGMLYRSEEIEKIWGKGFVTVAEVNMLTCQYVAGYVLKKFRNGWGDEYYYQEGRIPEYHNESRRPGIGKIYYDQHKDEIYTTDEIIIAGSRMTKPAKPPAYYDRLFDLEEPVNMKKIKAQRQHTAVLNMQVEDSQSTLTREERYELKRSILNDRMSTLKKRQNLEFDNRKNKIVG